MVVSDSRKGQRLPRHLEQRWEPRHPRQDRNAVVWRSGKKGPKGRYVLVVRVDPFGIIPDRQAAIYGPELWSTEFAQGAGAQAQQQESTAAAAAGKRTGGNRKMGVNF